MWPDLMGPGWQWELLAAVGLLAAMFALFGLMARAAGREAPASPDPLLTLWHRYEVGDLTRREFERARTLARRKPAPVIPWTRRPPAMDPAARRALNGSARPAKRGAAARAEVTGTVIYEASSAARTSPGSA